MQCIPGGNLRFWQEERKVSTVGKGVERGRCHSGRGWGVGVVRNSGGSQGTGQHPPAEPGSTGLGGGLLQEAFSDSPRVGEEHHRPGPPCSPPGPGKALEDEGCQEKRLLCPPGSGAGTISHEGIED